MKKLFLLVSCLLPFAAWGQSSPNWPTGYRPSAAEVNAEWASKQDVNSKFGLYAINFGVKADGVTPDGAAMTAAVTACSQQGAHLYLPLGQINMDGQVTTMPLANCTIEGVGFPAGSFNKAISMGTTLLLKSTSLQPFTCGSNWRITGVNFYYPNQTNGTTVYPSTIGDNGTVQCHHAKMDNFTVVNAYEFLVETPNVSWENMQFSDFNVYAVKTAFSLSKTGDSFNFINARFTPTPWFDICNSTPACFTAISAAAHVNAIYRATAQTGPGVTINVGSSEAFAWRYGFKVEAGATIEGSILDVNWDSVGTIIDATASGANWSLNNVLRGFTPQCGIQNLGSAADVSNCFQMGATSGLVLDHFSGAASGDWFQSSGSSLYMTGGVLGGIGLGETGVDHYFVNVSAGNALVHIRGVDIGYALTPSVHAHGIKTNNIQDFMLADSTFRGFNDVVAGPYPSQLGVIANNTGVGIQTPAVALAGGGSVRYQLNQWDNPPLAQVSACGAGAVINGTINGGINVGTAAGFTCTVTLPIIIPLMTCQFGLSIASPFSTVQVTGGVWRLTATGDISGTQISYRCGGDS